MGSRRRGREAALQMLYQIDVSGVTAEQAVHSYWAYLGANREGEDFATDFRPERSFTVSLRTLPRRPTILILDGV